MLDEVDGACGIKMLGTTVSVMTTTDGLPNPVILADAPAPVLASSVEHSVDILAIKCASVAFIVAQHALHCDASAIKVGQKHLSFEQAFNADPIRPQAEVHSESM